LMGMLVANKVPLVVTVRVQIQTRIALPTFVRSTSCIAPILAQQSVLSTNRPP
jgi:hypothetical protein